MLNYIIRRLFFIIPTLLVILTINFFVIQIAPGGPVEQAIMQLEEGINRDGTDISGGSIRQVVTSSNGYKGSIGLDNEVIEQIKKQYGFDKPLLERYFKTVTDYLTFDFGDSLFKSKSVVELIIEKLPVSISLGLWSTLLIYLISIPLGIYKAVKVGTQFDLWSSIFIIVGYAVPSFLLAVLLIVVFAGGSYLDVFPLRGLISANHEELSLLGKIGDYFWHICLPTIAIVISGFASLTLLTKNLFLDEISKQYVITAKAKGLNNKQILFKHVFRNATLLIVSGFPAAFIGIMFTGSLLIEIIFSLNGLGMMSYEAIIQRDYPIIFGGLFIMTLIGLLTKLITDITYMLIDPRIDFEKR